MAATNPKDTEELRKVFNQFDANGDGKISSPELLHILETIGSSTNPEEVERAMAELDTDKDGFISFEEFVVFYHSTADSADGSNSELREAFQLYDHNGNGLISSTELHQVLTRLRMPCSIQDCEKMIKSVDSDGDGCVNFEEFKKMMSSGAGAKPDAA